MNGTPYQHIPVYTDHLTTTYRPPTDHQPTINRPLTDHLLTNHLPTTYQPLTDHLPTNHLLTTYRPTIYWPPTDLLPTTYWPPTRPLFYGELVHNYWSNNGPNGQCWMMFSEMFSPLSQSFIADSINWSNCHIENHNIIVNFISATKQMNPIRKKCNVQIQPSVKLYMLLKKNPEMMDAHLKTPEKNVWLEGQHKSMQKNKTSWIYFNLWEKHLRFELKNSILMTSIYPELRRHFQLAKFAHTTTVHSWLKKLAQY